MTEKLHTTPLEGGANTNHFVMFEGRAALLRVPLVRGLNDIHTHYYPGIGFVGKDGGAVHRRSPREQHDFSRKAAAAGLAVLPPMSLEGNDLIYPFLSKMQTLQDYLHVPDNRPSLGTLLPAIFADTRKAHSLGFIYGDRSATNILVDGHGFIHIDFDCAISGRTAREFEIAEMSTYIVQHGGSEVVPILATTLGAMSVQTPEWIDMNKTAGYMRLMAEMLCGDMGHGAEVVVDQEALIAATYAARDSVRGDV